MDHSRINAYYRVSTRKQGKSGLGLEGQKVAIEAYQIVAAYTEVESCKIADRQEVHRALAHARRSKRPW